VAECTQLAGDRAKAEEILLENARSFLNAFVAENSSGWTTLEGDQYASSEVTGFLTTDWDRDAPACGFSPLLGDGVLDSLDPEPLVCNLPGTPIEVSVDIKPGSCPNSYNRSSKGVLPVAVVGAEDFDVLQVDLSTLEICSVDADSGEIIGCIAPHEGPPGPHSEIEDVTTPYGGPEACGCEAPGPDGILDLSLKFKTAELVEALQLDLLLQGALPELVVRGSLLDGTPFEGSDCVRLVPPGTRSERISVHANAPGAWIEVSPLDETLDGGGFSAFERSYPQTTEVTLTASPMHSGRTFLGWRVDRGSLIPNGTVSLAVDAKRSFDAIYQMPPGCGLGIELALLLPPLMWLWRRRARH
jgi:hypothetical protein